MIKVENSKINTIHVEADAFRGATISIEITALIDNEKSTLIGYNDSSTTRWGRYELNLSPTQSGPRATTYGFTGPGYTTSVGEYKYILKDNQTQLEIGILWIQGQNQTIY